MIQSGLDIFLNKTKSFPGKNIALIANQTSVTADLRYSWEVLLEKGIGIKRIFTPEHGLFATEQDQVPVDAQLETDCEIVSLYGRSFDSLAPGAGLLNGIDLVLFDIQDIGSRYYTYLNTMALFIKAIDGNYDVSMIVLDRPNPIGGTIIEGPLLEKEYESFVGVLPVAVRHGMTAGELALLYRDTHATKAEISVVKMGGWKRGMMYHETGLSWVPPSPNMPTAETALLYPGMCLIEGTNLSEGRGTATPFKSIGAPYIKPDALAAHLNSMELAGVIFRPVYFKPCYNKYAGAVIGGVYLHVTDIQKFRPFLSGVALVKAVYDLHPEEFKFIHGMYEFNDKQPAFDLLTGGAGIRKMILNGAALSDIAESWKKDESEFEELKRKYHLYEH